MIGFGAEIAVAAIASAIASVVALVAALLKKRLHDQAAVHVSIGGQRFEIENVNPKDIDAVLAEVKRQVYKERDHDRSLAETQG